MIDIALKFLHDQVNLHLQKALIPGTEKPLSLSPIVNPAGENAIKTRLGMALIKLDEERIHKSQTRHRLVDDTVVYFTEPDLKLNMYILVAASHGTDDGEEALRSLSAVVAFFQAQASFDVSTYPTLAPIDKLVVSMETVDFETQNHIWGALGAKYLPSVIYKVGVITIQRGLIDMTASPVLTKEIKSAS